MDSSGPNLNINQAKAILSRILDTKRENGKLVCWLKVYVFEIYNSIDLFIFVGCMSYRESTICAINTVKSNSNLYNTTLYNSNLYNSNLYNSNLYNSNLYNSNLYNSNLDNSNLYNSNLDNSNLYNSNLYNSNLYNSNLYNLSHFSMILSLTRTFLNWTSTN